MIKMQTLLRRPLAPCLLALRGSVHTNTESEIRRAIRPANNICSSQTPDRPNVTFRPPGIHAGSASHMVPFCSHCLRCQGFEAFMALKHHPVWGKDNQMTCAWRRHCLVDKVMRASVQNREPEVPDRDSEITTGAKLM